ALAVRADGARVASRALDVDVVSTLGAGDVFHGALLAQLVRGAPLPDALAARNACAGLSCRALARRSGVPPPPPRPRPRARRSRRPRTERIAVIPGDAAGPELVAEARKAVDALGLPI